MIRKIGGLTIFALMLVSLTGCWGLDPIDPWGGGGGNGGGGNGGGGNGGGGCGDTVIVDPGNGGVDTLDVDPWPVDTLILDPGDTTGYGRHHRP